MNRIEEDFIGSLRRVNFYFDNEEILTECIKDHNGFSLYGENFGPYVKGKKYRMKFFKAIPFIEHDFLKIDNSIKCDNVAVQRYAIAERDDQKLVQQENKHFMIMIKEFKRFIEKDVSKKIIPNEFLDRYNSYFSNLLDTRLMKILRLAKSELNPSDKQRLSSSEWILFKKIYALLNNWKKVLLSKE